MQVRSQNTENSYISISECRSLFKFYRARRHRPICRLKFRSVPLEYRIGLRMMLESTDNEDPKLLAVLKIFRSKLIPISNLCRLYHYQSMWSSNLNVGLITDCMTDRVPPTDDLQVAMASPLYCTAYHRAVKVWVGQIYWLERRGEFQVKYATVIGAVQGAPVVRYFANF